MARRLGRIAAAIVVAAGAVSVAAGIPAVAAAPAAATISWTHIAGGSVHTCGIDTSHGLWCWGYNGNGGLHSCATRTNRTLWCWGYNVYGQLGLGDTAIHYLPGQVTG
jgi:alpha-tubulin suppressor-like RCC1 family protein